MSLIMDSGLPSFVLLLDGFLHKRVPAVFRYWMWMLVMVKLLLPVHLALPTSPVYWSQAEGIVTDRLGRPRQCVVIASQGKRQPDFDRNVKDSGMLRYGGPVVDRKGQPIEGVVVQLRYDMPKQMSTSVGAAVTDDQGRWHSLLPSKCINFRLRSLDHPDYYVVGSLGVPTREELEKRTHRATMQFGCALSGRVVNEENQPVENALVCAEQSRGGTAGPWNQMIETCRTQRTRADGTFRIGGLPPGPREIIVFSPDYAPTIQTTDVQIGTGGITVLVKSGRDYRGHIMNAQGDPLEGVANGSHLRFRLSTRRPMSVGCARQFEHDHVENHEGEGAR